MAEMPEHGWYKRREIAVIFGFGLSYFDRDIRPNLPKEAVRYNGRANEFFAPEVYQFLLKKDRKAKGRKKESDGTVTAVERGQIAKAEMAELKLEQERGNLVPVAELRPKLEQLAVALNKLGEKYKRKSTIRGSDAQRMLNDALERYRREARTI